MRGSLFSVRDSRWLALSGAFVYLAVAGSIWAADSGTLGGSGNPESADRPSEAVVKTTKANFKPTTHPDAQWFGEAGLGLFIHWGISSVHGGLDLSWGMMAGKFWGAPEVRDETLITPEQYFALADRFKPDKFDPNRFLKAAREAGFRYAVMTTKHHDGFTMWPSDVGDFGVKKYLPGVDFVKDYIDACRAQGLKVGLYYSPPDWHVNRDFMSFHMENRDKSQPPAPLFNTRHEVVSEIPKASEEHKAAYHAYLRQQIIELLTRYGKIDLMWFDGRPEVISMDELRQLQPGMVVNPRMHGFGDFTTPEASVPRERIQGWWELCDMWASGWGYNKQHENYKSDGWMLERFTKVRGWGGNYLINVGPRSDGTLPDCYYERMKELSGWMKHSGVSVFGVKPGPYPEKCNVPVTVRQNTWYVHLAPTFNKEVRISAPRPPRSVTLLRTGKALATDYREGALTVAVPADQRTDLVDVIAVQWDDLSATAR